MVVDFVSDMVGNTVLKFIDLALTAVVIMIFWYVIKFFLVAPPTEADKAASKSKDQEKYDKLREWLGTKKEAKEKKKGFEKRKALLEPATAYIRLAGEAAEKLKDDDLQVKTAAAVTRAKNRANTIESNLRSCKSVLRAAKIKEKTEKKEFIQKIYDTNEVALKTYRDNIKNKVPLHTVSAADWTSGVSNIEHYANEIKGLCGYIESVIHKFIDEDKLEIAIPPTPGGPGGSA